MATSSTRTPSMTPLMSLPRSWALPEPVSRRHEPLEAELAVGQVEVVRGGGDLVGQYHDLLLEPLGGQVDREEVLLLPVRLPNFIMSRGLHLGFRDSKTAVIKSAVMCF